LLQLFEHAPIPNRVLHAPIRVAEQLANEEPGVNVPEALVQRMVEADRTGRVADEALAIARELVVAIRPLVAGIIVAGAGGKVRAALDILGALGTSSDEVVTGPESLQTTAEPPPVGIR